MKEKPAKERREMERMENSEGIERMDRNSSFFLSLTFGWSIE